MKYKTLTAEQCANNSAKKLKIETVTATDNFILVEGIVECKVYFAFYKNFIVCSGDYGEWQFDCTWQTVVDKIPQISNNENYLLGKLSRDNKKYRFDGTEFCKNLKQWYKEYKQDYKGCLVKSELKGKKFVKDLDEIVSDLINYGELDKNRYVAEIDKFMEYFNEIAENEIDYEDNIYCFGDVINPQLLTNLKLLQKVREYFEV